MITCTKVSQIGLVGRHVKALVDSGYKQMLFIKVSVKHIFFRINAILYGKEQDLQEAMKISVQQAS